MDDSFTWNEYGRPSYLTANAVGAEVDKGTVDAVYHGKNLRPVNLLLNFHFAMPNVDVIH